MDPGYLCCPECGYAITGIDIWAARDKMRAHYDRAHRDISSGKKIS